MKNNWRTILSPCLWHPFGDTSLSNPSLRRWNCWNSGKHFTLEDLNRKGAFEVFPSLIYFVSCGGGIFSLSYRHYLFFSRNIKSKIQPSYRIQNVCINSLSTSNFTRLFVQPDHNLDAKTRIKLETKTYRNTSALKTTQKNMICNIVIYAKSASRPH